jgi:site-specific recombinase XerD
MANLIYGSGERLMECLRLRVRDLEVERRALNVRDGKGAQDRVTVPPDRLVPLRQKYVRTRHRRAVHSDRASALRPAIEFADLEDPVSRRCYLA